MARGIQGQPVLLNWSNASTIAESPNIRPMNHLILYLPKFDIYADPALGIAPFGILPFGELGKPAIHLGDTVNPRRTIPMPPSGATMARLKTEMTLSANGEISGTTVTTGRGAFGISLRGAVRAFDKNGKAAAVTLLRQHGTPGTGEFEFDPPNAPGDDYTVRATFHLQDQSALLQGGFFTLWTGLRLLPRPGDALGGPMFAPNLAPNEPTFCYPGLDIEDLGLTLPEGREPGGLPPDVKIDTDVVRYRSHWSWNGRRVAVTREFQSLVAGPTCEGAVREDMADVMAKVRADMTNPIGIKQDELPTPPRLVPDLK
jgi:hypothetical protein